MNKYPSTSVVDKATILAAKHLLGQFDDRVENYILKPYLESKFTCPSSLSNSGESTDCEMQIIQWGSTKSVKRCTQNRFLLFELVSVIKSLLKNMAEEYIKELVFDANHMNLILLDKSKAKVIGGITYRPFPQQGFTEIAFAAVFSGTHAKGYGKQMMDRLKEENMKRGILYLLTYGDDKALGFFEKQGFRKTIELPPEKYQGELALNLQIAIFSVSFRLHKNL